MPRSGRRASRCVALHQRRSRAKRSATGSRIKARKTPEERIARIPIRLAPCLKNYRARRPPTIETYCSCPPPAAPRRWGRCTVRTRRSAVLAWRPSAGCTTSFEGTLCVRRRVATSESFSESGLSIAGAASGGWHGGRPRSTAISGSSSLGTSAVRPRPPALWTRRLSDESRSPRMRRCRRLPSSTLPWRSTSTTTSSKQLELQPSRVPLPRTLDASGRSLAGTFV
mmetsp:Transcript_15622/g.59367  ORF Transcript_15622/g.59367 Transcript_15622/m.59367 type:complete len:226 (+) Transcript_15622:991-1668(+)